MGGGAPDVVIVGGGVIGLATAYELSAAGARVTVLEARQVGGQASGAAAGIVEPMGGESPLAVLSRASLARFKRWAPALLEEAGIDIQLNRTGSLRLAFDVETAGGYRRAAAHAQGAPGERPEWLEAGALRALEPAVNPAALGGLRQEEAYNVYSPRYVAALAVACRRRGVTIHEGMPAVGVRRQGERVTAVESAAGRLACEALLIAAGAWSGAPAAWLDLSLPVAPDRGQIMALLPPDRPLRHVLHGGPGYAVPKADGLVVVGATHEDAGFDARVTVGGLTFLVELARLLLPSLAGAPLSHVWAGLRPRLASGSVPAIGRIPGTANAWLAVGHGAWGITLSPGTGALLAQAMLGRPTEQSLAAFAPERLAMAG